MQSAGLSFVLRFVRRLADGEETSMSSDDALLDRFVRTQDEWAFEQILQRYAPMVLGVCRRQLRDPHLVDDAFQATFLVFVRKAKLVRSASRLGSWLHSVAYRVAIKARNGAAKQARETVVDNVPDRDDEEAKRRELREVIDEELQKLPDYYRQPLVLCYLEGKTNAQAAEMLGCPEGTIYGRLNRGREKLRQRLARRGLAPTAALLAAVLTNEVVEASVPTALLQATVTTSRFTPVGSSIAQLADAVAGELGRRRLALYAIAALGLLAGIIVAHPGDRKAPEEVYPRRLLAVQLDHHLFVTRVGRGKTDGDMRKLVDHLGTALHIDPRQRQLLSAAAPTRGPVTKDRLERAVAGYLRAARPEDRVVLLLAAHLIEVRGTVYLMPFEGNPLDPSSLTPWSWVQARLAECAAQQKVVILDVARVGANNPTGRAPLSRLSKAAAEQLQDVPAGVQLWVACGQAEVSVAGDYFAGSLFLEELDVALSGDAVPAQLPDDPLPVAELAATVNPAVTRRARQERDRRQTPALYGQLDENAVIPFSKKPPAAYVLPRERAGDVAATLLQAAALLDRAHTLLDGPVDELRLIRRSQEAQPGKVVQVGGQVGQKIERVQVQLATIFLELRELLDALEGIEAVGPAWSAGCTYTRAHLMALLVRIFESNYCLSSVRVEGMPELEPNHQGWMLVSRERITAKGNEGRDAKDLYKKSQALLELLETTHEGVPWRRLALRDGIVHVGLVWQAFPLSRE